MSTTGLGTHAAAGLQEPQGPPLINLLDPRPFAQNSFWDTFQWLRAHQPIHRHQGPDADFWVFSRHAEIVQIYADAEHFSSRFGMRLDSDPAAVASVAQRMLIVSDAPEHTALKRTLMQWFGPGQMPRMEALVRQVVDELVDDQALDQPIDFIDLAKRLPNHVVCALMDLPRADWEWIGEVTTEAFDGDEDDERSGAHSEIFLYFSDLLRHRRAHPGDDFVSWVAHEGSVGDERGLTDEEIIFNCNGVLSGANETTRYSAAGAVLAFAEDPAQWARLRDLGLAGIPAAVEETLRWTTPGVHAMRTVTSPVTVAGQELWPGERVTLWNVSANRDEAVFTEPNRFVIDRQPNRHIAFGHGRHLCLGARLARYELATLFARLLGRVSSVELLAPPTFTPSNFTWGVRSLSVRLVS